MRLHCVHKMVFLPKIRLHAIDLSCLWLASYAIDAFAIVELPLYLSFPLPFFHHFIYDNRPNFFLMPDRCFWLFFCLFINILWDFSHSQLYSSCDKNFYTEFACDLLFPNESVAHVCRHKQLNPSVPWIARHFEITNKIYFFRWMTYVK